ncbi:SusD/RagB family nutrient-binding outer membrane lipoprotein [Parabacteroides faecis]|uniref:SusD/RagB family nutrient-binding outer membrane lipoprotein n=1 Tax=Parabacteroides faecis TaxID=1217282 RepID=UPI002164A58D|nr:SusD/RagB family nutrient-binding outer membrane lipoprotein [Parabacteroides faecis]MCS2892566.1 SusD/RagB family nutrient-binding outer membrane lipoprotein [Parabacteroides faecis]UVQ48797.1 SusD/RagB family nutrient-binding outer membrane lipoprotein [Parabacteroides faecis]
MNTIRKYITSLALGAVVAGTMVSCDTLDEKFYNPDKLTDPDFSLMFAAVQTKGHLFRYDYGATFHYMRGFGKMLGLGVSPLYLDKTQNNTIVRPWDGWSGPLFNSFIFEQTNSNYTREINGMKLLYKGMSDEEQAENSVYMRCCDIIQCYAFQRSTDLYDDIPYFEVGGAYEEKFYPKYDTQEAIYMDILDRLKTAAADLSAFQFSSDTKKSEFATVDLLCEGDLDRWIRMANSLRLRMAMRMCHVKPDVTISTIKELVAENRMLTEYTHDIGFEEEDKTHAFELTFFRGLDERGYESGAPATIIKDIMNYEYQPGDENGITRHDFDPRLYAMFQPDIHGRYIGLPLTMEEAESELPKYYTEKELTDMYYFNDMPSENPWEPSRIPAMYNRRTYFNFDMEFPVMGSTETNLLLAEATVRWPGEFGNINAKECIKKAIYASTYFYYQTNNSMSYNESSLPSILYVQEKAKAPKWADIQGHLADYEEFAANKFVSLTSTKDKLKFIFDQKFCHMNIMNPYEIYNEARRLVNDFNGELPFLATPNVVFQERMFYPSSELSNNGENFAAVAHKNTYDTPVWWTKRTVAAKNHNGNAL